MTRDSNTNDKFAYHRHLVPVALADVDLLLKKDKSYGASWKKSGGRSAWFMLARMMDRLQTMMAPPAEPPDWQNDLAYLRKTIMSEDIFSQIEAAPTGEDGTVIAVLRDLRRYALLVEAELVERGVLSPPDERPFLETAPRFQPEITEEERANIQAGPHGGTVNVRGMPRPISEFAPPPVPLEDSNSTLTE